MTNNQPKGQQVTDAKPDSVETLKRLVDDLDSEINNSWPIIDKAMASRVRDARPALAAAIEEIERLRKVVASLPKTADGVPVVQGMEFWGLSADPEYLNELIRLRAWEPMLVIQGDHADGKGACWDLCELAYSTKEAAIKAGGRDVK